MDIYHEIQERLKEERDTGVTQNEMAQRTGLGQSHISRLLDSKRGAEQMKRLGLETFFKLFPDAQIIFGGGNRRIGDVHHNTNSPVIQGDGNTVGTTGGESAAAFLKRIMEADDIDAETKVKIYRMMK